MARSKDSYAILRDMCTFVVTDVFVKAIAKAVYSGKEFLVFDDVFSGLDAATEDKVFCRLLGQNGLLRRARMSVLAAASTGMLIIAHSNALTY